MSLLVKRLSKDIPLPSRSTTHSAGLDLSSAEACTIPVGERRIVRTGLQIAVPSGHYARIAPRSGYAVSHGLDVLAGVVDEDFRGELMIVLANFGSTPFNISIGQRVAQLILEKISLLPVEEVKDLPSSTRGTLGFGSSNPRPPVTGDTKETSYTTQGNHNESPSHQL